MQAERVGERYYKTENGAWRSCKSGTFEYKDD
jgi:hypothetical protein